MPYNETDKNSRFALPIGEHNIHSGNGKLTRHQANSVGSELQVKAQLALAMGVLNSVVKLAYDGIDIPSSNYDFYKGTPGEIAGGSGSMFPSDVNHWLDTSDNTSLAASFINYQLPVGVATDNKPDKAVARVKCLEVEDYNSSGTQTAFGYSANPARCAVYGTKLITGRNDLIEWGSFDEFKSFCAEQITITKDSQNVDVDRFRLDYFFTPPFTLKQFLDKITQLTCSDWQWRGGKIRFIPAVDRNSDFDFDTSTLARDFKFKPIKNDQRPNGIRVLWRDLETELLDEAEPFIVKRDSLITKDGVENFFEINAGNGYRDQIERFANYWAKVLCDLTDFAEIRGSFQAYPILPSDLNTIDHPTPNWTNKKAKVIKKEEREDKTSKGVQTSDTGYKMYVRLEPENPYSDDDFEPITTRTEVARESRFNAPPTAESLTLSAETLVRQDGTNTSSVFGEIEFGEYGFGQIGKVYWKKPSGTYELLDEVTPDENNEAEFRAYNLINGTHYFKVVSVANSGAIQTVEKEGSIVISPSAFVSGQPLFNDEDVVNTDDINAEIFFQTVQELGKSVEVKLNISFDSDGINHNNTETVSKVEVDVFDQFGDTVLDKAPQPMNSQGGLVTIPHSRKYADALEGQSYYRIRVFNNFGWSSYVYLQGSTLSTTPPTAKVKADCPQNFTAKAFSDTKISINAQFSGNVDLYRRLALSDDDAWIKHNSSAISSLPDVQDGFVEYEIYVLQLRSTSNSNNRSNIVQVQLKPEGSAVPSRPAPTSPDGNPNPTTPQTQLDFSCVSSANEETEVYVDGSLASTLSAVAVGNVITFSISGLTAETSKSVKFRHKWGTGDYSDSFTEEITRTTEAASSDSKPKNLVGFYVGGIDVSLGWENDGGDGPFTIRRKRGTGGTPSTLNSNHTTPVDSYNDSTIVQENYGFFYYYQIKDNDLTGDAGDYTDWEDVYIPPKKDGGLNE